MRSATILIALGAAATVSASVISKWSGPQLTKRDEYPACVQTCIASAAYAAGCAATDAACLCGSQSFIDGAAECYASSCDAQDAETGVQLGQGLCAAIGVSITVGSDAQASLAGLTASGASDKSSSTSSAATIRTTSSAASSASSAVSSTLASVSSAAVPAVSSTVSQTSSSSSASATTASTAASTSAKSDAFGLHVGCVFSGLAVAGAIFALL